MFLLTSSQIKCVNLIKLSALLRVSPMTGRNSFQRGLAAIAVLLFVLCQFTCTTLRPYSSELGSQTKLQTAHHPFHCLIKHASHNQSQSRILRDFKFIPMLDGCAGSAVCIFAPEQLIELSIKHFNKAISYKLWLVYCSLLL